jgi:hypothetical protein
MAQYQVECASCGKEITVNLIGKHSIREWKLENVNFYCEECKAKYKQEQRENQEKMAEETQREWELPELQGTEKQIKWAKVIRAEKIIDIESFLEKLKEKRPNKYSKYIKHLDWLLKEKTKATFWIDSRYSIMLDILEDNPIIENDDEKERLEELKAESTIQPQNKKGNEVVEIKEKDNKIYLSFPKNDDIRLLVKELGYEWYNPNWVKTLTATTGSTIDRIAEVGNKILNLGYAVIIYDLKARENAILAKYEPEHPRWILFNHKKGMFAITWNYFDNSLYQNAKSLPKSKYENGSVYIPVEYYKEILDFANLFDFKISDGSKEAIQTYTEKINVVNPVKPKEVEKKDGLKDILKTDNSIIDDLKDE